MILRRGAGAALIAGVLLLPGAWGPSDPGLRHGPPGLVEGGDPSRGEVLFRELTCVRCHSVPRTASGINSPTDLSLAGSRAQTGWMETYLRDPDPIRFAAKGVRPRLRMPGFSLTGTESADLAAFLAVQKDTLRVPRRPGLKARLGDADLIREGRTLFAQYQCLGCHELNGEGNEVGPSLDGVAVRRKPEYIAAILEDPERVVPGTAMEDKDLWEDEILALTAYLVSLKGT